MFNKSALGTLEVLMISRRPHFPVTKYAKILGYGKLHDVIARQCHYSTKRGLLSTRPSGI
jgi:hypothetical protein